MESPGYAPSHSDASRPSLGFPLGTALLLIVIFSLSGVFSCCYHWNKIQALRQSFSGASDHDAEADQSPRKHNHPCTDMKKNQNQSLPVLMPGDQIPKFIAMPCPCEPPRQEKIIIEVQKPPPKPQRFPIPLYY